MFKNIFIVSSLLLASLASAQNQQEQITLQRYADKILKSEEKRDVLNQSQMKLVLSHVITHPVATILDPDVSYKYDPDGVIGFCFGRAMAVHLAARTVGLKQSSIRKIFIIGDMRSGNDPEWRFHVTTIVRGPNNAWFALDPIAAWGSMPRVLTVKQWAEWVRSIWDRPKPGKTDYTKIYMVDPNNIVPNLLRVPDVGVQNQIDIMSTTFNPSNREPYAPLNLTKDLYAVRADEQIRQFISTRESGAHRYNFTAIKVNGSDPYSYNGYFHDLLEVFAKTTEHHILKDASRRRLMMKESVQMQRATNRAVRARNSLGSLRIGR